MNPIVLGIIVAWIMNSATGNDGYIRILSNIKSVVNGFFNARLGYQYWNMNGFPGSWFTSW
jgi:hypothetical protein